MVEQNVKEKSLQEGEWYQGITLPITKQVFCYLCRKEIYREKGHWTMWTDLVRRRSYLFHDDCLTAIKEFRQKIRNMYMIEIVEMFRQYIVEDAREWLKI